MSYASTIAADGPVSWFRLIEQGGAMSVNRGSDGANLYAYGLPPLLGYTGIASDGGSATIGGNASFIAYPFTQIAAGSGYSLEAWMYAQGEAPFGPASTDYFVQMFINSTTGTEIGMTSESRLATCRDPSSTSNGASASTAAAFGWHHVCATRDSGATPAMHLYVDGALVGSSAAYAGFGVSEPVRLNLVSSPTAVSLFVAEPAMYYSTLSAGQVAAHAAAQEVTTAPKWINRLNGACLT